ncbi:MAG TPA: O-antigen ligase family protein, partial [Jatrophihabitans sp.]|nr:O-antigen ligase family protein [Jatrophihabitans sp.]
CARRLTGTSAGLLLDGLLALGALLAILGWYGVLRHHAPLAIPGQGLYRAASTLTYPNATGVLLAMLALIGIALPAGRQPGRRALLTIVLIGLAATLSRGAVLAFAAGLLVLATGLPGLVAGLGPRRVLTTLAWPLTGAALGTVTLLPSMPVTASGNPALAVGGLLLGVAVGSMRRPVRWAYGALAGGVLAVGVLRPFPAVTGTRLSVGSPDRWAAWRAAWRVFTSHPLTGAGPGLRSLSWRSPDGTRIFGYAHNEYLQLLATLGVFGPVLLLAGLVAVGVLLRSSRPPADAAELTSVPPDQDCLASSADSRPRIGAAAAAVALLVSMALDFTGHFPVLVLTAAAVAGCAVPVRPARP